MSLSKKPILSSVSGERNDVTVEYINCSTVLYSGTDLVQDFVVVCLCDAHELAVVDLCPHHSLVIQFLHGGRDAEATTENKRP